MDRLGRHGSRAKRLRHLARRRQAGLVLVDGLRLAADLARWGVPIRELYLTPDALAAAEMGPAIDAASEVLEVEAGLLESIAPTRSPQGVLAVVEEPSWPPWSGRTGPMVWLDRVQDPGNLGAIVRSAAALGARGVLLSPGCADPFAPAAVRGAAGAVMLLPVERDVTCGRAAARVREHNGSVWAAGLDGRPVGEWSPVAPVLLLLGAEGTGLSESAARLADETVTIPLQRGVESLNVAVAAAILLDALRERGVSSEDTLV